MLIGGVAADILPKDKRSGFEFMSPQTQAMQTDETSNPGMLWVIDGERLWQQPQGSANKSCASCHDDAAKSMRGVAARYPAFDERTKQADRPRGAYQSLSPEPAIGCTACSRK